MSCQIHKNNKQNGGFQGLGARDNEELLFKQYWALIIQAEKSSGDGSWWWLHNTELYT